MGLLSGLFPAMRSSRLRRVLGRAGVILTSCHRIRKLHVINGVAKLSSGNIESRFSMVKDKFAWAERNGVFVCSHFHRAPKGGSYELFPGRDE